MGIQNVSASSGHAAYAEALRAQQREQAAQRIASTLQASQSEAKVTQKTFGIRLGKLGIDFTSQDVEIPTTSPTSVVQRSSFSDIIDAATILQTASQPRQTAKTSSEPNTSTLARRQALEAYAEASLNRVADPGRSIGSV